MVLRSRFQTLGLAALGALAALTASVPARATSDQPLVNLGPVGPREPILAVIGNQRVIAFYVPERGECQVNAVVWSNAKPDAPYASARVRLSLRPGQMFQLDGAERQSMNLLCGADAATLAVVGPAELITTGATSTGRH